ncbi:MAG: hypothetical protein CMH57_06165 [Myxococcales bacterium]|nr:hypothetical protein [Myxococcales bacterium]
MSRKVLLVDDETSITRAFKAIVAKEPYTALTASCAEEALEIIVEDEIDVVISDENMPGMRGTDFLLKLRNEHPEIVRVLLTGYAELELVVRAINEVEIYRLIRKPWKPADMIRIIQEALLVKRMTTSSLKVLKVIREQGEAMRDVMESRSVLPAVPFGTSSALLSHQPSPAETLEQPEFDELSSREKEVMQEFIAGNQVAEVAENLYISPHTVRNHLKSIFRKLGVRSQAELLSKVLMVGR